MWADDSRLFEELAQKCGNRYLAVRWLATAARQLAAQIPGVIVESKLISWVLHDVPASEIKYRPIRNLDSDIDRMESLLEFVDDVDIQDAVRWGYKESLKHHHLIYSSNEEFNLDPNQAVRARILLRMLWYGYTE